MVATAFSTSSSLLETSLRSTQHSHLMPSVSQKVNTQNQT